MTRTLVAAATPALFAASATLAFAQEAVWRQSFETTEGLTTGWGQGTDNISLSLSNDPLAGAGFGRYTGAIPS